MVNWYCGQIRRGYMTIDNVPKRWKTQVAAKLGIDLTATESTTTETEE